MLYMVVLYLLTEKIGFGLDMQVSYFIATAVSALLLAIFLRHVAKVKSELTSDSPLLNDQKAIKELYPELISK